MNRRDSNETHSGWPQHFQHENPVTRLSVNSRRSARGIQRLTTMKMT